MPFETQLPTDTPIPFQTPAPAEPTPTAVPTIGRTIVVNSTADSGPGTLRQALLDALSGDMITFDPTVFPPAAPATIYLTSGLPEISKGELMIDASNAGVVLDGSNIGKEQETTLIDDFSLTLNGGPNLIANGEFSDGFMHWRAWDEATGVIRDLRYSDYHSAPTSFSWTSIAHAGDSFTVFDPNSLSDPFDYFPQNWIYGADSTVWIPVEGGSAVDLRFWYRSGPVIARLHTLLPESRLEHPGEWSFDWQSDWTEAEVNLILPEGATGIALEMGFGHSERWTSGLTLSSSGNTIQGLQIVGFPGPGIELLDGARNNTIGGDQAVGAGQLGQGNLLSGNGNRGIILSEVHSNTIVGNQIGTDIKGTAVWGNRWEGIHMNKASSNQVTGNLISGNNWYGIDLCCNSNNNIFSGNIIGADVHGTTPLANKGGGVTLHDGSSGNHIGPNNIITFNALNGIEIGTAAIHNTITKNSIHDNMGIGIDLYHDGNRQLISPFLSLLDVSTGTILGHTCNNCTIEIFSDSGSQGAIYEGQTTANESGDFIFHKGGQIKFPYITATVTDIDGNTSELSMPVTVLTAHLNIQEGNTLLKIALQPRKSSELVDNHIGGDIGNWKWQRNQDNTELYNDLLLEISDAGLNWVRTNFWSPNPLNWQEVLRAPGIFEIPRDVDQFITALSRNGINVVLTLSAGAGIDGPEHGGMGGPGWGILGFREPDWWFNTQESRDNFIAYVSFMVQHFKGRVRYYEIWNEPSAGEYPADGRGGIAVNDYASVIKQVVPVIRQINPDAKVVVGAMGPFQERERQWLSTVLDSGIAPFVDAVSWHAFSGDSPLTASGDFPRHEEPFYWRDYPVIVMRFKDNIAAQGFSGEFMVEETVWRTSNDYTHETPLYTDIEAAKYAARANIIHLGLDFTMVSNQFLMPDVIKRLPRYYVIRNLSTTMAGTEPASLPMEIKSEATNLVSYTFSLSNGDHLIALWTDGVAVEDDPGDPATLTIPNFFVEKVIGIDILHGFEQELITSTENGNLVIRDLLVKDYPLILRLSK